jgi:hypothetical protein
MEPQRDPRRDTMDWRGWKGWEERPQDGQLCVIRCQESSGGLVPRLTIYEITAVYRESGWKDRAGHPLGYVPALLAWRPATAQEQSRR